MLSMDFNPLEGQGTRGFFGRDVHQAEMQSLDGYGETLAILRREKHIGKWFTLIVLRQSRTYVAGPFPSRYGCIPLYLILLQRIFEK